MASPLHFVDRCRLFPGLWVDSWVIKSLLLPMPVVARLHSTQPMAATSHLSFFLFFSFLFFFT
jgi:hypothetical protein